GSGPAACRAGGARRPAGPAPAGPGRRTGIPTPGPRTRAGAGRARHRAAAPSATAGRTWRTHRSAAAPRRTSLTRPSLTPGTLPGVPDAAAYPKGKVNRSPFVVMGQPRHKNVVMGPMTTYERAGQPRNQAG